MSEILGALFKYLVALLGVVAVVAILFSTFGANRTQNAISDLTQLQTGAQALYNNTSAFTTLTNTVAIASRIAPTTMISGTNLVNPWGGAVTIAVDGTTSTQFTITEAAVPADSCTKIASAMSTALSLKVGSTSVTTPADPGTVAAACSAANNTLVFTFGH